ncbi:lipoprotein-releasing system transmembrane subunit LolC, partial [Salmonella enterica subsp. enterica serovar Typhimurium]
MYAFRFRLYSRDFANSNQTDYMYQPVALIIGMRYMRGRAADRFGRFVSWLSTIGITLGVMALVTVLSVMNGFERELQNNILGLMPQAILSAEHGSLN